MACLWPMGDLDIGILFKIHFKVYLHVHVCVYPMCVCVDPVCVCVCVCVYRLYSKFGYLCNRQAALRLRDTVS